MSKSNRTPNQIAQKMRVPTDQVMDLLKSAGIPVRSADQLLTIDHVARLTEHVARMAISAALQKLEDGPNRAELERIDRRLAKLERDRRDALTKSALSQPRDYDRDRLR